MNAWLFDLGTTRLKCAPLHAKGERGETLAFSHRDGIDLAAGLARVLPPRIDVAYLASVVDDDLRVQVLDVLVSRCARIAIARSKAGFGQMRIAYAQPHRLGVDRFLALLAVHDRGEGAALVCSIGTAMTVDLLDRDGRHRGGRIAPSPTSMRQTLHKLAPHLPLHGGVYREFADDTDDALASGCEGAALGLIERSLEAAWSVVGSVPALYLHGGGSEALLPQLPTARWHPDLVLDGLAIWAGVEIAR